MGKHGTDLYTISKEYKIPYKTLVNYFYINYNGGNEQTKSLKELEFAFEKKQSRSKKKNEKTAVVTRSRVTNNSKPHTELSPSERKEHQRNIVQSVLNKQGVDDRTKYDVANYDNTNEDKDEEELKKEAEENKIRLLPNAARRQNIRTSTRNIASQSTKKAK